jgi:hypothetical protein
MKILLAILTVIASHSSSALAQTHSGSNNLLSANRSIATRYMKELGYSINQDDCLVKSSKCLINYPKLAIILESYVRTSNGDRGPGYNNLGRQISIFYSTMNTDGTWDDVSSLVMLIATNPRFLANKNLYIYKKD